jgi:hypothetical protein
VTEGSIGRDAGAQLRAVYQVEGEGEPALLPARLAQACTAVLGAAGAGLSLVDKEYRLPLGASSGLARSAERLQFTLGEGPCLEAAASGQMRVMRMPDIEARWPSFASELSRRTPFDAIVSLPMLIAPEYSGAVDLYVSGEEQLRELKLADASDAVQEIARILAPGLGGSGQGPGWLRSAAARARGDVWIAIGMLMVPLDRSAPDILALLRSYAYARDTTLDDIAAALASGALDPAQITI